MLQLVHCSYGSSTQYLTRGPIKHTEKPLEGKVHNRVYLSGSSCLIDAGVTSGYLRAAARPRNRSVPYGVRRSALGIVNPSDHVALG